MKSVFPSMVMCVGLACSGLAQQASYTTYGTGCGGWAGEPPSMPMLSATGVPRLGAKITVQYQAPYWACRYSVIAFLATGVAQTVVPLPPIPNTFYGGPNCTILTSGEVAVMRPIGQYPTGALDLAVPNSPALLGVVLYQQWWLYYIVSCPIGTDWFVFVTNGGKLTIGT
ncbi:MAG: hypothetical protein IT458_18105 [Planctomycetes bacterium]|nr:hypothetical protein [Planctomycetota bacterium]